METPHRQRGKEIETKVCPVVFRVLDRRIDILAFRHPVAGNQFVKGTVKGAEEAADAARRELREESGLTLQSPLKSLGTSRIGPDQQTWHFFSCASSGLPEKWEHVTEDDHGHSFSLFWHSLDDALDESWHPIFHEAFAFFRERLRNSEVGLQTNL